jgi:hypothetical protein
VEIHPERWTYANFIPATNVSERWQRQTDELDEAAATRAILIAAGIPSGDLSAITAEIARRGWIWRLSGGGTVDPHLCSAAIVIPWRDSTPWTEGQGTGPAAALGEAFARAVTNPPPENGEIVHGTPRDWRLDERTRFFD